MKTVALVLVLAFAASCEDVGDRGAKATPRFEAAETETANAVRSQLFRIAGTTVLSAQEETKNATALPVGYNDIPNIMTSDDGIEGDAVDQAPRPTVECGTGVDLLTLAQRLRDCANKNAAQAEWKGVINGTSGEGTWKLVARAASEQEIWLDETTGFMWSHVVSSSSNWCKAASNNEGPVSEGGINCSEIQDSEPKCDGKSFLGIPASQIAWRLPTRNDFLQADLNGARFVLPKVKTQVWTATVSSTNRDNAWSIVPETGLLLAQPRSATLGVRCLGRRLK